MIAPVLTSDRLCLRPLEVADAARVAAWQNDPAVARTLRTSRRATPSEQQSRIATAAGRGDVLLFAVVDRETGVPIGTTGYDQIDLETGRARMGLTIGVPAAWGKGYGREVLVMLLDYGFHVLRLNRLWAETLEFNHRARRCLARLGFRVEGRLRQDLFRDDRYWDTWIYGLLRDEWPSVKRSEVEPGP